jgi:hypothetical protein
MNSPLELGGGRIVAYAALESGRPTGATIHTTPESVVHMPCGLVICKIRGESGWFLFHCDKQWNVLADSWHTSEAEARSQAEFEYEGVSAVWRHPE